MVPCAGNRRSRRLGFGVPIFMKDVKPVKNNRSFEGDQPKVSSDEDTSMAENLLVACEKVSSERYQAFVENIEEGVYEVDLHGNFLYFNQFLCNVFGYPKEEIQFQNFTKFMTEEYAKQAFETFNRIYKTGRGFSDLIWRIKDKKGETRIIDFSANQITDEDGKIIGFRGIARDITNKFKTQRALQESERRYKTLLDFVPHPLVVFTLDGHVSYLNPAFTTIFGWSLHELVGKRIPYIPPGLEEETSGNIRKLFEDGIILRHETQRLTKDGQMLDVALRAAVFSENEGEPSGELVLLRNITHQKRIERNNEALLRTSMALPEYPDLDHLLGYISAEVKQLLEAEGSLVILLDKEKNELFFKSGAHDDSAIEKRMKEVRFPATKGVSGRVIRTGEPVVVADTSKDPDFYSVVDTQVGFKTKSLLDVPLRSGDQIVGVLCVMNKKRGTFDDTDVELLNTISGTVALSIENARVSMEIKEAYKEVTSLNRAKDKVINHLSHELRTPLAVLGASLGILGKRLASLPPEVYEPTIDRARRNLARILDMQYEVEDIMREQHYDTHHLLSLLLDECTDELEALVAEEVGEGRIVKRIKKRIDEIFGPKESRSEEIQLDQFVFKTLEEIKPRFSHRKINLNLGLESAPSICMPVDPLKKLVVGLVKNAIENTPDEGKIEVKTQKRGEGVELSVRDYGVGITRDNQKRIFEGFFVTQETMDYSTKQEFDFNAGGKGADLLRMKIFSERYNFKINMVSSRCRYIPLDQDVCPGNILKCDFCKEKNDCYASGGTIFTIFFPSAKVHLEE